MNESRARLVLLTASVLLSLVVCEGILRLLGFGPWTYLATDRSEPTVVEYDLTLGWRSKQGRYEMPSYDPSGGTTTLTILPTGLRKSSAGQTAARDERPKILFVGGSFTQGWALSDQDTYPWKVQQELSSFEVLNYGTNAYGTYQSLLLLEMMMPTIARPRMVVYGFIEHHEDRNVATGTWLELLASYSHRAHVYVPYVSIGRDGALHRHPPERYPALPLREDLAISALVEKALATVKTHGRADRARKITQQLMLEMKRLCSSQGADFAVALFDYSEEAKASYMEFFRKNGIGAIDCYFPRREDLVVPGEGHPNGKLNSLWAECITAYLTEKAVLHGR